MTRGSIVVVAEDPVGERVAGHLNDIDDVAVTREPTLDVATSAVVDEDAVCVVLCDAALESGVDDALGALDADGAVPVVLFVDGEEGPPLEAALDAGVADVVRHAPEPTDAEFRLLARRVEAVMGGRDGEAAPAEEAALGPGTDDGDDLLERLERLHGIAARLEPIDAGSEMYAYMVDHADDVLPLTACAIGELDDGTIRPRAATATDLQLDVDPLTAGEGVAGRTIAEGRTVHLDDVADDPEARPSEAGYRSVLSVPLGEHGVFQVLDDEPGTYSALDRGLAELLATLVEYARDQVTYKTAVARERDRFAALFENIPDAAVQYTVDGDRLRIDAVNGPFVRLFGFEAEDAVGQPVRELLVPDDEREAAAGLHDDVVAGRRVEQEVERQTADGTAPFLLRNVPIRADDGADRGYLIYTDIGPLKERERQLEAQNERLDRFASIISHDLRNPLAAAMARAELAVETGAVEQVETVQEELDRMERMIGELLTLAREGEVIAETKPVDLGEAAREAWAHVDTRDATLSVEAPPTVDGDRARIEELYENVFRNAVEHGGDDVTVTVGELRPEDDGAEDDSGGWLEADDSEGFYVADDGRGIPDDRKDDVLETGFTTADSGTGFGLSIVEEIANSHGWRVSVADSEDGGARIEIRTDADEAVGPSAP